MCNIVCIIVWYLGTQQVRFGQKWTTLRDLAFWTKKQFWTKISYFDDILEDIGDFG